MLTYWLRLYPQQPLGLSDPRVIPGRAIRGALASVIRSNCLPEATHDSGPCNARCQYWLTFGSNAPGSGIRVSDASATAQDAIVPFRITARTCPMVPGFISENGHGVVDTAIRAWIFEQAVGDLERRDALLAPYVMTCAVCGTPLIACTGQVLQQAEHDWRTVSVSLNPVSTNHRPTAASGQPWFTQTGTLLRGSTYYVARMDVPENLDALLRQVLGNGLIIGARRTRGQGLVRAELVARPDPLATTHTRIVAFNRALRNEQRFYSAMNALAVSDDDGAWYFTLDTEAVQPAYYRQPDPLAEIKAFRSVGIVRRWQRAYDEDGRNTATGLRSGRRLLLSGTFICRAAPDADRSMLEQTLAYLETHGFGLGNERGFGLVTVCDPFHLELDPV